MTDMEQRLDEHNRRVQEIIDAEKVTAGCDGVPISRMIRADIENVLRLVAGRASTLERIANEKASEVDSLVNRIEELEACR